MPRSAGRVARSAPVQPSHRSHRERQAERYETFGGGTFSPVMIRLFRFSPYRLALIYVLLCTLVLAIFVIPLAYVWRLNYSTSRTYVDGETRQTMVGIFEREGPTGLAAAIDARVGTSPPRD